MSSAPPDPADASSGRGGPRPRRQSSLARRTGAGVVVILLITLTAFALFAGHTTRALTAESASRNTTAAWSRAAEQLASLESGTAFDAAIRLDDDYVSTRHARVVAGDDGCYVEDLGSTNGTYVNGDKVDALVAEVADQTVRARIRAIAEERDQLRHDLQILRKAYQRLAPVRDLTAEQCYGELPAPNPAHAGSSAVPPSSPTQTFTNAERESVRKFLDENFLYDEGFRIDEIHGLVTGEGRIVLPIAFITALRKVLGS